MRLFWLIITALLVWILAFGVTGHSGLSGAGTVELAVIVIWLYAWLFDRGTAITFSLVLGILFDLVSFLPFGYWTAIFLILTSLVSYLKESYLTVSSYIQAVAALLLVSLIAQLVTSVYLGTINYLEIVTTILLNCILGALLYYMLAVRLKLFSRWIGARL